ncbi:MAG: M43 family zinc metalloprotease [Flavobacteriales bacterium]|nr:M43 family zinc metalloprotease [Flavobacteriales bacterium]MCX7768375.1 M43 family zinc metalloprotease [Flavobacteriales bacterium]MDW8409065.1 M43 family zinc metalloprotease [Flavobacteriales bacterium]
MKKLLGLPIIAVVLELVGNLTPTQAQSHKPHPGCAVNIHEYLTDPAFAEDFQKFNAYVRKLAENAEEKSYDLRIIPVVFHIVHQGSPVGQNENLSNAQIQQIVQTLNEVFSKQADNINTLPKRFDTIAVDPKIQFRLARKDPQGNCTDGIRRVYAPTKTSDVYSDVNYKRFSYWDRSKYLNIWIVNNIESPFENQGQGIILGFCNFPGTGSSLDDGCTVAAGAALTQAVVAHEIGHHLNLIHTWGDEECGDDQVDDTPIQKDVMFSLPNPCDTDVVEATCYDTSWVLAGGDSALYKYKIHMRIKVGENYQNIMNYVSNYNCPNMFTKGQADRMRAALDYYPFRRNLWQEDNLLQTGVADGLPSCSPAPKAEFWATKKFVCVGESVSFRDGSFNGTPNSWQWEFPGGTPSTSTQQNPTGIKYAAPGIYPVKLTVSNANGSDVRTKEEVVVVGYPETKVRSWGYSEGFEYGEDFEQGRWTTYTEPAGIPARWEHTCATSYGGFCALRMSNFFNNVRGQKAYLISPSYDLNAIQLNPGEQLRLRFRYAYALNQSLPSGANSNFMDALRISYSKNCGTTWQPIRTITKSELVTAGIYPQFYTPTEKVDWYQADILIPSAAKGNDVRFMFEFTAGLFIGNNLYLDDIEIVGSQHISAPILEVPGLALSLQPNPALDQSQLIIDNITPIQKLKIDVLDLSGRLIKSYARESLLPGAHAIQINREDGFVSGLYILKVQADGERAIRRLVFQ